MAKTATKTAAKAKTARKPVTKKVVAKKAAAPKVNPHEGLKTRGVNRLLNGNRKPRIMVKDSVAPDNISADKRTALYALREHYGQKQFAALGLDNGILRDLAAAGLISMSGGQQITDAGNTYMVDGENPVNVKLTSAGMSFGKA